jgi:hypothetical protein
MLSHLFNRLMQVTAQRRAARTVQLLWRKRATAMSAHSVFIHACHAIRVQRWLRRRSAAKQAQALAIARAKQAKARGQLISALGQAVRVRHARRSLLAAKSAAVALQAASRMMCARATLAKFRVACVLLQGAIRRKSATRREQCCATLVQARIRLWLKAQRAARWAKACTVLQRQHRGFAARKAHARARVAAITLQSAARSRRALAAANTLRASRVMQAAARTLQAIARGQAAKLLLASARSSASAVQAAARGIAARKGLQTARAAAVALQTSARGRHASIHFAQQRTACVRLQCYSRRIVAVQRRKQLVAHAAASAACLQLQSACRRRLATVRAHNVRQMALHHAAEIATLHKSVRFLQQLWRYRLLSARRRAAARVLSARLRVTLAVRERKRRMQAILSVQSIQRGCVARKSCYKRHPHLRAVADRVIGAYRRMLADPSAWMGNRTSVALNVSSRPPHPPLTYTRPTLIRLAQRLISRLRAQTLLHSANLGHVLRAVASLEMFTLIAEHVCALMVLEGAVNVIFKLIRDCNRSTPHLKVVGHALRVLHNIGRHPRLLTSISQQTGAAVAVAKLAWDFREKPDLLSHTINVLEMLLLPSELPVELAKQLAECKKKLESVIAKASAVKTVAPVKKMGAKPATRKPAAGGARLDSTGRLKRLVSALAKQQGA